MNAEENKELREAYESLLWGSRELSIKTKAEARALARKIQKLDEENDVELSKVVKMANHLRQELKAMLEASQSFTVRPGEKYFHLPIANKETARLKAIYRQQFPAIIVTIVSVFIVSSLGASAYLLYTRIVIPLDASGRLSIRLYLPILTAVGTLFAIFYILQLVRASSWLVSYRNLHNERIELGQVLHSTETTLLRLMDLSSQERDRANETSQVETVEDKILWRQYDAAVVDFLYRKRKPT